MSSKDVFVFPMVFINANNQKSLMKKITIIFAILLFASLNLVAQKAYKIDCICEYTTDSFKSNTEDDLRDGILIGSTYIPRQFEVSSNNLSKRIYITGSTKSETIDFNKVSNFSDWKELKSYVKDCKKGVYAAFANGVPDHEHDPFIEVDGVIGNETDVLSLEDGVLVLTHGDGTPNDEVVLPVPSMTEISNEEAGTITYTFDDGNGNITEICVDDKEPLSPIFAVDYVEPEPFSKCGFKIDLALGGDTACEEGPTNIVINEIVSETGVVYYPDSYSIFFDGNQACIWVESEDFKCGRINICEVDGGYVDYDIHSECGDPVNAVHVFTVEPMNPNVNLEKEVELIVVEDGNNLLQWTSTFCNTPNATAPYVGGVFTDNVGSIPGVTFVSTDQGTELGGIVTWNVPDIAVGDCESITIITEITDNSEPYFTNISSIINPDGIGDDGVASEPNIPLPESRIEWENDGNPNTTTGIINGTIIHTKTDGSQITTDEPTRLEGTLYDKDNNVVGDICGCGSIDLDKGSYQDCGGSTPFPTGFLSGTGQSIVWDKKGWAESNSAQFANNGFNSGVIDDTKAVRVVWKTFVGGENCITNTVSTNCPIESVNPDNESTVNPVVCPYLHGGRQQFSGPTDVMFTTFLGIRTGPGNGTLIDNIGNVTMTEDGNPATLITNSSATYQFDLPTAPAAPQGQTALVNVISSGTYANGSTALFDSYVDLSNAAAGGSPNADPGADITTGIWNIRDETCYAEGDDAVFSDFVGQLYIQLEGSVWYPYNVVSSTVDVYFDSKTYPDYQYGPLAANVSTEPNGAFEFDDFCGEHIYGISATVVTDVAGTINVKADYTAFIGWAW